MQIKCLLKFFPSRISSRIFNHVCSLTLSEYVRGQSVTYEKFTILLPQKFLKQQDQNLMRQFVKLRGVLNSIKNRPPPSPSRKISLPANSPTSPISPLYRISEDSPGTYFRGEASPGLRRRAQSDFAGSVPENYPVSPLSLVGEDYEHFAI